MFHTRRFLLAAAAALATPGLARAQALDRRGFHVDLSVVPEGGRAALEASLRSQVDLVESLDVDPELKAWFRSVPLRLNPELRQPGRVGPNGLELSTDVVPAENPVLLHELLHVYQARRLTGGPRNPELIAFYEAARASGDWPAQAYMLSNLNEFFAMTGSVALWGRAARLIRRPEPRYRGERAGRRTAGPCGWRSRSSRRVGSAGPG
jgi:hypothetical protein